jgi:hypothetical protein
MIYALLAVIVIQSFLFVVTVQKLTELRERGQEDLLNRIMAMSQPDALMVKNAAEDTVPARVSYNDDEEKAQEEMLQEVRNGAQPKT